MKMLKLPQSITIVNLYSRDHKSDDEKEQHILREIGEPDLDYSGRVFQINFYQYDEINNSDILLCVEYHLQNYVNGYDYTLNMMSVPILVGDKYEFGNEYDVRDMTNNSQLEPNNHPKEFELLMAIADEDNNLQYWRKKFVSVISS